MMLPAQRRNPYFCRFECRTFRVATPSPQIRCPFCNEPVFYCKLPNEGSAYFDSVGHPWPKHPCTDKSSNLYRDSPDSPEENWPCFDQIVVEATNDAILRISGKIQNEEIIVFLRRNILEEKTAPEQYLRESILQPSARVVAGYQPVMPAFQGIVNEEQLLALIEYVKSLSPGQQVVPR